ncbi:hypothetical protein F4778DRAFT_557010 [Xylariomycetidae sp. FL2044]|nr:hypothetical protein F4778DRAFT_557010 [Xylariomycetidae sp. FL2044]
MGIRKWRFGSGRKESSVSSNDTDTNGTTTPTETESPELSKSQSRIGRITSGFKSHRSKKSAGPDEYPHLHKPFTPQNLEHQKMLNAFEWNFGKTRRMSLSGQSCMSGISPTATRHPSVDYSYMPPPPTHWEASSSSIVRDAPREAPRDESHKNPQTHH